jgi:hypothetical protein
MGLQAEGTPSHDGDRRRTRRRPGGARRCSRKRSALVKRGEGEGVGRLTAGVQPPRAGPSPTATYPPGRHPGHRPRPLGLRPEGDHPVGLGCNDSVPAHPPAATGRACPEGHGPKGLAPWACRPRGLQTTMAPDAEHAGGRVGQDDVRARSLLLSNEARRGRWPANGWRSAAPGGSAYDRPDAGSHGPTPASAGARRCPERWGSRSDRSRPPGSPGRRHRQVGLIARHRQGGRQA